jgi:hypothetical protein
MHAWNCTFPDGSTLAVVADTAEGARMWATLEAWKVSGKWIPDIEVERL